MFIKHVVMRFNDIVYSPGHVYNMLLEISFTIAAKSTLFIIMMHLISTL